MRQEARQYVLCFWEGSAVHAKVNFLVDDNMRKFCSILLSAKLAVLGGLPLRGPV